MENKQYRKWKPLDSSYHDRSLQSFNGEVFFKEPAPYEKPFAVIWQRDIAGKDFDILILESGTLLNATNRLHACSIIRELLNSQKKGTC